MFLKSSQNLDIGINHKIKYQHPTWLEIAYFMDNFECEFKMNVQNCSFI